MARQSSVPRPLEGRVTIVGARPKASLTERNAAVADLSISLTGGTGTARTPVTFLVELNVPLASRARAQLIDEATQSPIAVATRSGGADVFKKVPVRSPGRYRITNIRANASGIGAIGSAASTPVLASVALSASAPIPLTGARQTVASLRRT